MIVKLIQVVCNYAHDFHAHNLSWYLVFNALTWGQGGMYSFQLE
jgi:hypothetical protein